MSEWKCGNCEKIYSFEQFIRLASVKLVEDDSNPDENYGYTPVCECGYRFHIDKWRLYDIVKIGTDKGDANIQVSTIFLEFNDSWIIGEGKEELWFETMIFLQEDFLFCCYQNRYRTKDEAIEDHNRLLDMLRTGKYRIEKVDGNDGDNDGGNNIDNGEVMELIIDDSEDKFDIVSKFIKALRSVSRIKDDEKKEK